MKKFFAIIVTVSIFSGLFSSIAVANPNDEPAAFNPTPEVVVTYTAPDAKIAPAATPKVDPAKLGDALHLQDKFRRMDNPISFR